MVTALDRACFCAPAVRNPLDLYGGKSIKTKTPGVLVMHDIYRMPVKASRRRAGLGRFPEQDSPDQPPWMSTGIQSARARDQPEEQPRQ